MNQRILAVVAVVISCGPFSDRTNGQDAQRLPPRRLAASESAEDLEAIREGSQAFVEAFNRADAQAVAALWAPDGEYIDEAGRKFEGRAAIEKEYAAFFSAHP